MLLVLLVLGCSKQPSPLSPELSTVAAPREAEEPASAPVAVRFVSGRSNISTPPGVWSVCKVDSDCVLVEHPCGVCNGGPAAAVNTAFQAQTADHLKAGEGFACTRMACPPSPGAKCEDDVCVFSP